MNDGLQLFDLHDNVKRCTKCRKFKPLSQFHKSKKSQSGFKHYCMECSRDALRQWQSENADHRREYARQYRANNPDYVERLNAAGRERYKNNRDRHRNDYLRRTFGMTLDEYRVMESAQDGCCAICRQQCKSGRSLAVDHNHETGEVRGLLCGNCNRAIGLLQEDPELFAAAVQYLLSYQDVLKERF